MANRTQLVTDAPAALAGAAAETAYTIQNVGRRPVFLATAAALPAVGDSAWRRAPDADIVLEAAAGEAIYVWCAEGDESAVTFDTVA